MKKPLSTFGAALFLMAAPASLYAQQTLEEATDSIKYILTLAKRGDANAQNEVGRWYYSGRHVKQNYDEALQWWSKAAQQGNAKAIGNMGLCYQLGHGIEADSLKAVKLYQRSIKDGNKPLFNQNMELAEKGSVFSNMLIASCYREGIGVDKDATKAIPFLTAAADKNCTAAQRDLGIVCLTDKKPEEAAKWFKRGADNDNLACIYYYGKLLLDGQGVRQDKKDGANYLLKAAEGGFPQAMFAVGNCYMTGDGLTKNSEQAVKWYRRAAGHNITNAQWALAQCLREGNGTTADYDQALYWYAKAGSRGLTLAFKNLIADSIPDSPFIAYMKGVKAYGNKDFEGALKEFKAVEKAKIEDGKVMEAAIMANPAYAKHNMKKGIKLLNEAAKSNPQAMYLLATLYEAGKGVDKNMEQAVGFMNLAATKDYAPAECALADMYFEGRGVEQSYSKAAEWYGKAYEQGQLTESAAKRYASCYENGWGGLDKDPEKAEEILKGDYKGHINELLKLI